MKYPRVLVVYRRSTYSGLLSERRRKEGVVELIEKDDPLVTTIIKAHHRHEESMTKVKATLEGRGVDATWRHDFSDLNPNDFDLVVTVGGDGTVLHTSHSINQTPVLAVNSSPSTSAGFLTAATADNLGEVFDRVDRGDLKPVALTRMQVALNGVVVTENVLNDVLFCHDCPASTSRYVLIHDGHEEDQLSSGVWVSTSAGSTAAIRAAGGKVLPVRSRKLQFVVREPFPSGGFEKQHWPTLNKGVLADGHKLEIRSKIETGQLYVDGPHVTIPVKFGDLATFSRSKTPLNLIGYLDRSRLSQK